MKPLHSQQEHDVSKCVTSQFDAIESDDATNSAEVHTGDKVATAW